MGNISLIEHVLSSTGIPQFYHLQQRHPCDINVTSIYGTRTFQFASKLLSYLNLIWNVKDLSPAGMLPPVFTCWIFRCIAMQLRGCYGYRPNLDDHRLWLRKLLTTASNLSNPSLFDAHLSALLPFYPDLQGNSSWLWSVLNLLQSYNNVGEVDLYPREN